MLWTLFLKECRQMLKCLTYYVIIICMLLMYTTQLGSENVSKPVPGQESYGFTQSEDESVIMDMSLASLTREYQFNSYAAYPIGFYKKVVLSKGKQKKMGDIISEVTGIERDQLDDWLKEYYSDKYSVDSSGNEVSYSISSNGEVVASEGEAAETDTNSAGTDAAETDANTDATGADVSGKAAAMINSEELQLKVLPGMTYEHFTELMTKADKLLGGGSGYAKDKLQSNAYVPMTYEQALKEYNDIIEKDHLTGAYARLFCDYLGITLAILPVFIAVTRGLRDRRAKAVEIIGSRRASSLHIVLSRYLAMVTMLLLPVLLLSSFMAIECINTGVKEGITLDYLAFPKYILGWLLPTIMVTTSVGVFLTELTDTALAIVVQGFWWFISAFTGNLLGNCGWSLIPRHNTTGKYDIFMDNFGQFALNRIVYTLIAVILLFASVYLYERKRKGRLDIRGKIFPHRKIKFEE